jgi:hypothetical protein
MSRAFEDSPTDILLPQVVRTGPKLESKTAALRDSELPRLLSTGSSE